MVHHHLVPLHLPNMCWYFLLHLSQHTLLSLFLLLHLYLGRKFLGLSLLLPLLHYSLLDLEALMALIADRRQHPKEGSYTNYLFDKGLDKILKKVGEESTEVIVAGKGGDRGETIYEIADLAYHVLVLMAQMGISVGDIRKELAGRHVIDKKTKQETSSAK